MLALLLNALRAYIAECRSRRQMRVLLDKDDRTLRDIGVTREDVEIALGRPYTTPARREAERLSRLSLGMDRAL